MYFIYIYSTQSRYECLIIHLNSSNIAIIIIITIIIIIVLMKRTGFIYFLTKINTLFLFILYNNKFIIIMAYEFAY